MLVMQRAEPAQRAQRAQRAHICAALLIVGVGSACFSSGVTFLWLVGYLPSTPVPSICTIVDSCYLSGHSVLLVKDIFTNKTQLLLDTYNHNETQTCSFPPPWPDTGRFFTWGLGLCFGGGFGTLFAIVIFKASCMIIAQSRTPTSQSIELSVP